MNRCPESALLLASGEGVLPEDVAASVQAHLAGCRVCRQLREDLLVLAEPDLAGVERMRARVLPRRVGRHWAAGAIAAALVFGIAYWQLSAPAPAPVPVAVLAPPPVMPPARAYRLTPGPAPLKLPLSAALVLRGQDPPSSNAKYLSELGGALEPYRAQRYAEAASALADLAKKYPAAVEPVFYEGVSRLLGDDAAAAVAPLEQARRIGGDALHHDIDWYLAAAYERTNQWAKTAPLLEKLFRAENDHRATACAAAGK